MLTLYIKEYCVLHDETIFAHSLPDKTLALTFDDGPGVTEGKGPGPRTLELAEYLAGEKVFVSFFFLGQRVRALPDVVREVHALGHLIGNHTQDHPSLDVLVAKNQTPVTTILEGDLAIRETLGLDAQAPVLFRAPYGNWNADVAKWARQESRLARSVGPIGWDMPVREGDWHFWGHYFPPQEAADAFMREIEFTGRGVIDLHDHASDPKLGAVNRTFEMMQLLVPLLKDRGYSFVRLDEIAEIKVAMGL